MMLIAVYNSATLVSKSVNIRKSIQELALESKLLTLIGKAEKDKEVQQVISKVIQKMEIINDPDDQSKLNLDEKGIKNIWTI